MKLLDSIIQFAHRIFKKFCKMKRTTAAEDLEDSELKFEEFEKSESISIQAVISEPTEISDNWISQLITVNSILCESEAIANTKFKNEPQKLLDIINAHHIGLENLLKKLDIVTVRSSQGDDFDPETMTSSNVIENTDNPELDGTVARSVTPAYYNVKRTDKTLIKNESIILFNYQKDKI